MLYALKRLLERFISWLDEGRESIVDKEDDSNNEQGKRAW
jgi:hypothetical protein